MPAAHKKRAVIADSPFLLQKETSFLIFRVLTKVWILLNL